ncbi:putative endonuclease-reverse transcriptase [Trichonephila clavipes]|nr:putative endonuclease-reverse transcriptase [Trichonephila clavipes]
MRARAYCAHPSIRDHWELRYMSRSPDQVVSLNLTLSETKIVVKVQNDLSDSLEIKNDVLQGDTLACLLFKLALEKVVRDSNINTRGNINNKSMQLLAFADDIDIIARTKTGPRDGTENQ